MATLSSDIGNTVKYWWVYLLSGILLLITSFYVFRYPVASYLSLSIFLGYAILFYGVFQIVFSISNRESVAGWVWQLVMGIIDVLLGIYLIANPGISMATLPFIVGFWVILRSFSLFSFPSFMPEVSKGTKTWLVIGGIVIFILGLLIIFNPAFGMVTIITFTGAAFFLAGVYNIMLSFGVKNIKDTYFDKGSRISSAE